MRRRDLMIAAGAVGTVVAAPQIIRRFQDPFRFEPHPSLAGFRRLQAGSVTSVDMALIGVDTPSPEQIEWRRIATENPEAAVFGDLPDVGTLPVAVFTDYNCPFCPEASEDIAALRDEGLAIDITWHDYPLLGPRSEAAARLAIAAGFQGAYEPVHMHLMRTVLRPGPGAVRRLAQRFELDATRLANDAASAEVSTKLEQTRAAASVFGLFGTPSILFGNTVVIGYLRKQFTRDLIEIQLKT